MLIEEYCLPISGTRESGSEETLGGPPLSRHAETGSTFSARAGRANAPPVPGLVGRYSVEAELGHGGMGVVYLAQDARLGRKVAIKSLPQELALDAERIGRFLREAKLLASLHHPNIATIHGMEAVPDGRRFLILEYVPGSSLAARLASGPLPWRETLPICSQIAAAIAAAHERGVIHRDLKPSNVMVTPHGLVKVVDFGLAKVQGERMAAPSSREMPRTPSDWSGTGSGLVVGTPGYLSPEQVMARVEDGRTDVFAFGCVLYECLVGRRAFRGATPEELITAPIYRDPDWSALPAETPAGIRDLLADCLEKDPVRRIGNA